MKTGNRSDLETGATKNSDPDVNCKYLNAFRSIISSKSVYYGRWKAFVHGNLEVSPWDICPWWLGLPYLTMECTPNVSRWLALTHWPSTLHLQ